MLGASDEAGSASKVIVTRGQLPKTINSRQPPHVKKPFSVILDQHWSHMVRCSTSQDSEIPRICISYAYSYKIEIILPDELFNAAWKDVESHVRKLEFSKVFMPLLALLEGDFFNVYIKSGMINDIHLLSHITGVAPFCRR